MNSTKQIHQIAIDKYFVIVQEYVTAFESLIINIPMIQHDCMFYIGLNTINRVYEYILMKQCDVKKAVYYSQKAYVYFIEWMEQIHSHDLAHTINHNDAILFIYKKTIFETNCNESQTPNNTMTNIFSLQQNEDVCNMDECIILLQQIHCYINCLLYWDNAHITTENRIYICKQILPSLLKFTRHIDITTGYLEYIRSISTMTFTIYCELLLEISITLRHIPNKQCKHVDTVIIEKCYIDRETLCKKIEESNMNELACWLYEPLLK